MNKTKEEVKEVIFKYLKKKLALFGIKKIYQFMKKNLKIVGFIKNSPPRSKVV